MWQRLMRKAVTEVHVERFHFHDLRQPRRRTTMHHKNCSVTTAPETFRALLM